LQPLQDRQALRGDEDLDASWRAGLTTNEAISFERDDHLMDRGRADAEMALDVGFGGWAPKHVRIGVDEGQVLALLLGKALIGRRLRGA